MQSQSSLYPCCLILLLSTVAAGQNAAPAQQESHTIGSKVHVVFIALTEDPSIGRFIQINVPEFESLIRSQIRSERLGSFTTLLGNECTESRILKAVNESPVAAKDTLFVYYEGHGVYDESPGEGDPDQGHFFALPGGNLPRKELLDGMLEKSPRLTILMSDCCNVKATAEVPLRPIRETRVRTIVGWTPLEELLLSFRGVIDVTASSRDEFSWFSSDVGGWYTTTFQTQIYGLRNEKHEWSNVWPLLVNETEKYFQLKKAEFAGQHPDLDAQKHMRPMKFRLDVQREDPADVPSGEIQIESLVTKFVPVD
jgi:Caspase domain